MQIKDKNDFFKDNVRDGNYCGVVLDTADPLKLGRIKVEVYGFWEGLDVALIPWAIPGNNITAGSKTGGGFFSVPKVGAVVEIKFDNGNIYCPVYTYNQRISDELKDEVSGSYENAHSIIYDTTTSGGIKIYFTEASGLMMNYKDTKINIKADNSIIIENPNADKVELLNDGNITIETKTNVTVKSPEVIIDAADKIDLGKGAYQELVLGNRFMSLFNSHTHIGVLGIPTAPPTKPMTSFELSSGGNDPVVKTM